MESIDITMEPLNITIKSVNITTNPIDQPIDHLIEDFKLVKSTLAVDINCPETGRFIEKKLFRRDILSKDQFEEWRLAMWQFCKVQQSDNETQKNMQRLMDTVFLSFYGMFLSSGHDVGTPLKNFEKNIDAVKSGAEVASISRQREMLAIFHVIAAYNGQ